MVCRIYVRAFCWGVRIVLSRELPNVVWSLSESFRGKKTQETLVFVVLFLVCFVLEKVDEDLQAPNSPLDLR